MKIVKIKVNKEKLDQELKKPHTKEGRISLVRRYGEGFCSRCDKYATVKVLVPSDKAIVVTRFCDKHGPR